MKVNSVVLAAAIKKMQGLASKITLDRREFNRRFLAKWSSVFSTENAPKIKADDITLFLEFSENQHWSDIHRASTSITSDMPALRLIIASLLDESIGIADRIDKIDPVLEPKPIPGLDSSVYTAILAVAYPQKYPLMNKESCLCLASLNLIDTNHGTSPSVRYSEIIDLCDVLARGVNCSLLELDELLHHAIELEGLSEQKANDPDDITIPQPKVWAIAAGENGSKWEEFRNSGEISIGWPGLGNLDQYKADTEVENGLRLHYPKSQKGRPVNDTRTCYDFAHSMAIGDIVVSKQGLSAILGIGRITSPYFFKPDSDPEYPNRRTVKWEHFGNWTLPDDARVPVKTLTDVTDYKTFRKFIGTIDPSYSADIASSKVPGTSSTNFQGFSIDAFRLLESYRARPVLDSFTETRDKFATLLAAPMAMLLKELAPRVVDIFGSLVETKKNIISRIRKNDYGRGGIHSHYWAAFFPRAVKRMTGTQLFVYMHPDSISAGFAFGDKAENFLERLTSNLDATDFDFESYVEYLASIGLRISEFDNIGRRAETDSLCSLVEFMKRIEGKSRFVVEKRWHRDEAAKLGPALATLIQEVLSQVTPLFALASFEDFEQFLPPEQDREIDGLDHDTSLLSKTQTPPLTSEAGWAELADKLSWHNNSPEIKALRRILQKGFDSGDHSSKQMILVGPPGTGKTRLAKQLALGISSKQANIEMVQFHQSYSYEDFIEGIRPKVINGQMTYQEVSGPFVDFCRYASKPLSRSERFVFIIDEINRGNVSRIFGELLYLLEYRGESLPLLYSKTHFTIPDNVFIIATMNSADRSLALVDYALRRRFKFIEVLPSVDVIRSWYQGSGPEHETALCFFQLLNDKLPDPRLRVGHSYFLDPKLKAHGLDKAAVEDLWHSAMRPLLQEYFASTPSRMNDFDFFALWNEASRSSNTPEQRGGQNGTKEVA